MQESERTQIFVSTLSPLLQWVYYMMTCRSINGNLMRAADSSIIEVLYPSPVLFPGNRVGGYIVTEWGKMNEDVIKALVHVVFVGGNFI